MKQIACLLLALAAVAQFHGHFGVEADQWPESVKNGVNDTRDYLIVQIYEGVVETQLENYIVVQAAALGVSQATATQRSALGSLVETSNDTVITEAWTAFQSDLATAQVTLQFHIAIMLGFITHHMEILRETTEERFTENFADVANDSAAIAARDTLIAELQAELTDVENTFVDAEDVALAEKLEALEIFGQTTDTIWESLVSAETITAKDVARAFNNIEIAAVFLNEALFLAAEKADDVLEPLTDSFAITAHTSVDKALGSTYATKYQRHVRRNPKGRDEAFETRRQTFKKIINKRRN